MSFREIISYISRDSWIHKIAPEFKLVWAIIFTVFFLIESNIVSLAVLLLVILLIFLSIRPNIMIIRSYMLLLAFLIISTTLSQGFFYYRYYQGEQVTILFYVIPPQTPIISLITMGKGIALVLEGLIYGLMVGIKLAGAILVSVVFISTTTFSEMMRLFQRIKIPHKVSLTIILAMKFIPFIVEDFYQIFASLRQKGEKISIISALRHIPLIIRTLIYTNIKRSLTISVSLEMRSFHGRIPIIDSKYQLKPSILLALSIMIILPLLVF